MLRVKMIRNRFGEAGEAAKRGAEIAVREAALAAAADARQRAPKRTGAMAAATVARKIADADYQVTAGMPYSGFVEFGTSRGLPARPWFSPAMHKAEMEFPERCARAIREEVERIG